MEYEYVRKKYSGDSRAYYILPGLGTFICKEPSKPSRTETQPVPSAQILISFPRPQHPTSSLS